MRFQFDQLSGTERYHLITQTITPRPIAWILTKNSNATFNLAPFSYFAPLSSDPALLVVSIGNKDQDTKKDTKENLLREEECVVHIPSGELVEAVNQSAMNLGSGESEVSHMNLALAEFTQSLPRVKEAKVALHCRLFDRHQLGNSNFDSLYLEILDLYISDDIANEEESRVTVDHKELNPLGRLGGNHYSLLGETLTLKRPN
ncbi:flavin reductase family protein [Marinomonas sp. C2222]|uniref:Flavin reductase family protein n=1 Tax=Marinomonas sargassi TaxID=2984494 RepID=A0ABT2YRC2_9GAMM|nr:flavin reductase family protein [Marinomonas sargassi]MCV2402447.1 flavin reductase family protein [Marinomonas sargassi]